LPTYLRECHGLETVFDEVLNRQMERKDRPRTALRGMIRTQQQSESSMISLIIGIQTYFGSRVQQSTAILNRSVVEESFRVETATSQASDQLPLVARTGTTCFCSSADAAYNRQVRTPDRCQLCLNTRQSSQSRPYHRLQGYTNTR
jgi:predicted polyphosphate/ATP-dependent NAD kinase